MLFMSRLGRRGNGELCMIFLRCVFADSSLASPSLSGLRKQWCPEIVELVDRMWAQEHQDRPTMSEVVEELEQLVKKY